MQKKVRFSVDIKYYPYLYLKNHILPKNSDRHGDKSAFRTKITTTAATTTTTVTTTTALVKKNIREAKLIKVSLSKIYTLFHWVFGEAEEQELPQKSRFGNKTIKILKRTLCLLKKMHLVNPIKAKG